LIVAKNFNILATSLNVLYIIIVQTKLLLDLYLAKFLDISAKSFFPCKIKEIIDIQDILEISELIRIF